jgi:hypothetical protein
VTKENRTITTAKIPKPIKLMISHPSLCDLRIMLMGVMVEALRPSSANYHKIIGRQDSSTGFENQHATVLRASPARRWSLNEVQQVPGAGQCDLNQNSDGRKMRFDDSATVHSWEKWPHPYSQPCESSHLQFKQEGRMRKPSSASLAKVDGSPIWGC